MHLDTYISFARQDLSGREHFIVNSPYESVNVNGQTPGISFPAEAGKIIYTATVAPPMSWRLFFTLVEPTSLFITTVPGMSYHH